MERIQALLVDGELQNALQTFVDLELRPEGISADQAPLFYTMYYLTLVAVGDSQEAHFLNARAPIEAKEGGYFQTAFSIGSAVLAGDSRSAHAVIQGTKFPESLSTVIGVVLVSLRNVEMRNIGAAYSSIAISDLAERLGVPVAAAAQAARDMKWVIDDASGNAFPKNRDEDGSSSGRALDAGVESLVQNLSSYVAHFEAKPLTVDNQMGGIGGSGDGGSSGGGGSSRGDTSTRAMHS